MTDLEDVKIESVSVLSLQPGDTLIVKVDRPLTEQAAAHIKQVIASQVTVEVPVVVAERGVEFSIARPDDTEFDRKLAAKIKRLVSAGMLETR